MQSTLCSVRELLKDETTFIFSYLKSSEIIMISDYINQFNGTIIKWNSYVILYLKKQLSFLS